MVELQSKLAIRSGLITLPRAISKMSEQADESSLDQEPSASQDIKICVESNSESVFQQENDAVIALQLLKPRPSATHSLQVSLP